ncbi:MAG TPA: prepilin-type N-terminal cleavage/methylation domain-containing protein [Candidatus Tripitaka californicus]|uniref:prepilin-type N-terminal cleavage/methylation domain-containing protein n=1 Tax=Candidatus Tripitaka californicus TaxID=3367616 RepID=UPI00402919EC
MRPEKSRQHITNAEFGVRSSELQRIPHSAIRILHSAPGFSLLEIVMVLAIMGLMAGTVTPVAFHLIGSKNAFANRDELQALKKAIIGDPLATQWGSEATFGYVGDIGSLPTSLQDLYTQPGGVSSFSFDATLTIGTDTITPRIGSGWRGPYVAEKSYSSSTETLQDPYKNTYSYSTTITTDATLGAEVRATIRSPGPNRTDDGGTQDDLTERVLTTEVLADVAGMIKNSEGVGVPTVSVSIIYPSGSSLTSASVQTDDEGRYQFSNIPIGQRAIFLQPGLVYVPGTAYAGIDAGTGLQEVEFRVANLSSSSVAITSTKATYNIAPTTNYTTVKISNVNADGTLTLQRTQTGTFSSGATVGFASVTAAASTMQREPFRLLLQSSRIEIPDIELTTIGAGSTKTIELQGFTDSMAGIPFKIEFSNGSKAVFTPRKQS